jgi:hypothetical protein
LYTLPTKGKMLKNEVFENYTQYEWFSSKASDKEDIINISNVKLNLHLANDECN